MTFNWLETERVARAHAQLTHESTAMRLARENARLVEENERLARKCADLAASAELWIQLYEAALARAEESGGRAGSDVAGEGE